MKFTMNGREWLIKEIEKEEIIEIYEKETKQETITVYGITKFENNTIYLNEEMCHDMKRQTLMHELMHCYIKEYISLSMENFDDEGLCNISANSHDIIHEIVEEYFKPRIEIEQPKVSGEAIISLLKNKGDRNV